MVALVVLDYVLADRLIDRIPYALSRCILPYTLICMRCHVGRSCVLLNGLSGTSLTCPALRDSQGTQPKRGGFSWDELHAINQQVSACFNGVHAFDLLREAFVHIDLLSQHQPTHDVQHV